VIEYGHGTKRTGVVLAIARSPKTGHDFALVETGNWGWPHHSVDLATGYLKVGHGQSIGPVEWADDVTGKWRRR
jgi:hypothetical protein